MRLLKQFIYGFFYLLVLAGIGWGIYFYAFRPAPSCFDGKQNGSETGADCGGICVSCEIKNLQPLVLGETDLFSADRVFSASAEIQNPNSVYGAKSFDYEVNFYDAGGKVLASVKNKGFIYAGESKNIIEAGTRITAGIPARAEIKLNQESVVWEKSADFFRPDYALKDLSAVLGGDQIVVSGSIANLGNYNLSRAAINAFLIGKNGEKIGASKTELQNIRALGSANFKIFIIARRDLLDSADLAATAQSVFAEVLK